MGQSVALGELEIQVLEHLWAAQTSTVKQVHAQIQVQRAISANTVQSTLERLHRKQLLSRVKQGHSYVYSALVSKEQLMGNLIVDLFGRFQSDPHASAAAILNAATDIDDEALAELELAIKARRKERNHDS